MQFLPELKKFLKKEGIIYTVRGYDMVEKDVHIEGIGVCHREPLGEVRDFKDLEQYVPQSGFPSLESWVKKIRRFIQSGGRMWLYKVEVKTRIGGVEK